jgi:hypothetical protein
MLLMLYFLPLLFKVCQRSGACCCYIVYHYCLRFNWSGSCCCCYIVYHYCLRFDRGVIHVVVILSTITIYGLSEEWIMLLLLYCLPLLFKIWQRIGSCCCCYIVYHYCLWFERGVGHAVVILSTIIVHGLREEWFMLWLL